MPNPPSAARASSAIQVGWTTAARWELPVQPSRRNFTSPAAYRGRYSTWSACGIPSSSSPSTRIRPPRFSRSRIFVSWRIWPRLFLHLLRLITSCHIKLSAAGIGASHGMVFSTNFWKIYGRQSPSFIFLPASSACVSIHSLLFARIYLSRSCASRKF